MELSFYGFLMSTTLKYNVEMQSRIGICIKDCLGLLTGISALLLFWRKEEFRWVLKLQILFLVLEFAVILFSTNGNLVNRVDSLINATLILTAMVIYTALQLERSDRNWQRIRDSKPTMLDLKLTDVRQWFNPIEIGPKLELSGEIYSVVDRYLATSKELRPLGIMIRCPNEVSESMRATMQEVFQMYYADEVQRINLYLERRYIRAMALVIISIIAVTVWIYFSPTSDEGVTWTILSNFAAFSLWQIGNTYFERSEGYSELLRAQIAEQAILHFWAE